MEWNMLEMNKVAIYLDDDIGAKLNKLGISVILFASEKVLCVIAKGKAGNDVSDYVEYLPSVEIVSDVSEAKNLGATSVLYGMAPNGGRISDDIIDSIDIAISYDMQVVHGFHQSSELLERESQYPNQVVNLRKPEAKYLCKAKASARKLNNKRVLLVGTDMAVGKMTAALKLTEKACALEMNAEFLATGQTGIAISGSGVPLDAVALDFTGGAVEVLVEDSDADIVFVEGQGSILNPASAATLPLIRGSAPTHFILCHDASLETLKDYPDIKIPNLLEVIELYENISSACGLYASAKTIGICVNTSRIPKEKRAKYLQDLSAATSLPVVDPVSEYDKLESILISLKEPSLA